MACIFCVGQSVPSNVKNTFSEDNKNAIEFLCQQLGINLDIFDLTTFLNLQLNFCQDCCDLFDQIKTIKALLEEVKGQLVQVLSKIKQNVTKSHDENKDDSNKSRMFSGTKRNTYNCRLLRAQIIQSGSTQSGMLISDGYKTDHNYPKSSLFIDDEGECADGKDPLSSTTTINLEPMNIDEFINEDEADKLDTNLNSFPSQTDTTTTSSTDGNIWSTFTITTEKKQTRRKQSLITGVTQPPNILRRTTTTMDDIIPFNPITKILICTSTFPTTNAPVEVIEPSELQITDITSSAFICELCILPGSKNKEFANRGSLMEHLLTIHKFAPAKYQCPQKGCNNKFNSRFLYNRHMKCHSTRVPEYECEQCNRAFSRKRDWLNHMKYHLAAEYGNGIYYCKFCTYNTKVAKKLRLHEHKEHEDELKHICHHCNEKYSSKELLSTHLGTHASQGPYQCSICPYQTNDNDKLEEHLIYTHVPARIGGVKKKVQIVQDFSDRTCNICGKIFKKGGKRFLEHMEMAHGIGASDSTTAQACCSICQPNKILKNVRYLTNHFLRCHENDEEKPHSCSKCDKKFATEFMLNRHINLHKFDNTKPLVCDICDLRFYAHCSKAYEKHLKVAHVKRNKVNCSVKYCEKTFSSFTKMYRHERKSHPELLIYSCNLCDNKYSVKSFLTIHLKTHPEFDPSAKSPFSCTHCNGFFNSRKYLANHLKKHTGEELHNCTEENCSEQFDSIQRLKIHLVHKHNAEKEFSCEICPKRYISKVELIKHTKSSHSTESHECQNCGKQFISIYTLKTHVNTVHNPQFKQCDRCGKSIKNGQLKLHMMRHENVKPCECYFCHKKVLTGSELITHMRIHTKERPFFCHICPNRDFTQIHCLKGHLNVHHKDGTYFSPLSTVKMTELPAGPSLPPLEEAASSSQCSPSPISLNFDDLISPNPYSYLT